MIHGMNEYLGKGQEPEGLREATKYQTTPPTSFLFTYEMQVAVLSLCDCVKD